LNAKQFSDLCRSLGACQEGQEWIKGKSLDEFWQTCDRADWMLWILGKQIGKKGWPDRKTLVLLACLCAETALKFVPAGEDRPRKAIETARAWCEGKATLAEVRQADAAADAADAAAAAAYAAAYDAAAAAAAAAAYAAAADAAAYTAAAAYAAAAAAAAYAAYAAAAAAARKAALEEMAGLIRAALPKVLA
jgi:hypothetical protein